MKLNRSPNESEIDIGDVTYKLGRFLCHSFNKRVTWPTSIILLALSILSVLTLAIPPIWYPWLLSDVEHLLPPRSYRFPCSEQAIEPKQISVPLGKLVRPTLLIVYNFYDHRGADENFEFFLKHALHMRQDTHFLIVLSATPCVHIPSLPNLAIVKYDKMCYGYGAIFDGITSQNMEKAYERYIILGSWVRGPFMPSWSQECWNDAFMRPFNIPEVFMLGTTHTCQDIDGNSSPQLHSTAWAFKQAALESLLHPFSCHISENGISRELEQSGVVRAHIRGWNIASLDPGWRNFSSLDSCGSNWKFKPHPYETIFINPRLSEYLKYLPHEAEDFTRVKHVDLASKSAYFREYSSMDVCT